MKLPTETFVFLELAGSTYAVSSRIVQHLDMVGHITLVPHASPAVDGVVFSRGQVVPALNLRARFGFPREPHTPRSRIVFVRVQDRMIGLIADAAREFKAIPAEFIRPIEETLAGIQRNYLQAVAQCGDRLVLIMDIDRVVDLSDFESNEPAGAARESRGEETASSAGKLS
jgi:purine-binding chemotaxis protein CheW